MISLWLNRWRKSLLKISLHHLQSLTKFRWHSWVCLSKLQLHYDHQQSRLNQKAMSRSKYHSNERFNLSTKHQNYQISHWWICHSQDLYSESSEWKNWDNWDSCWSSLNSQFQDQAPHQHQHTRLRRNEYKLPQPISYYQQQRRMKN